MNRYQQKVAELDHQYHWRMRLLSSIGAACLVVAALWAAGVPPSEWWTQLHGLFSPPKQSSSELTVATQPLDSAQQPPSIQRIAPSINVLAGTESSTSATPQPLYLLATTPGRNFREGTALIGTNPDNPQTYLGGAILASGARLAEIHRDHVVLKRGDISAKLELYRRSEAPRPVRSELLFVGGEREKSELVVTTREVLTDYMRPSPVFDGENLRGYEVYPGPKAAVFSQLGLQAGDVITSLNDMPLTEPAQALELLKQITQGVAVVVTVQRKGARQRITLDGSLISADQERGAAGSAAQVVQPSQMPAT